MVVTNLLFSLMACAEDTLVGRVGVRISSLKELTARMKNKAWNS